MEKITTNRNFGLVFFVVFLLIGIWPILHQDPLRVWSLVVSLIFLFLGLLNSRLLSPINFAWIKFGNLLGKIVAPIVMGVVYFFVVTPTGLLMRLVGKDLLRTKNSMSNTYWIIRKKNIESMKRQF
tara:strand:- start:791 stop:1168 length:378 start_codon:yes stop_codon:yes gene_type:complete